VLGVDISADGSRIASAGEDGTVRLWDALDGTGNVIHKGELKETDVSFSPDGTRVLGVGFDGFLRLWNARTGEQQTQLKGGDRELFAAAFSSDGQRFAAGGADGVTRVWSVVGGPPLAVLRGQRSRVYDVGFGATSDRVVSAGDDGTARLWDAGRTRTWVAPSATADIDFSPDGRLIASGGYDDGIVRIWDSATGRLRKILRGPAGYTPARFSPTADEIVIAQDATSSVLVWPLSADRAELIAKRPKGRGMNVARFDRGGRRIVYVDTKGGLTVRDLRSGREVTMGGVPKDIWDAQLSPDGEHVAGVGESGKLLIWRIDHPAHPERVFTGHRGQIVAVAYSRDGRIVTAGSDRTVRVWNPLGGPAIVLRGLTDEATTAIFTNDGAHVLSSASDGTLRMWDARGGDPLVVLQSGGPPIYDVTQSRDGTIATLSKGEIVRVFKCDVCGSFEQVLALARSRGTRPLSPAEKNEFLAAAQ
jgi:WD40 repeat protein